jgi:hypothetical protein
MRNITTYSAPNQINYEGIKQNIIDFIILIDNHNAESTIGTLEFLDHIAKYNQTNSICFNITDTHTLGFREIQTITQENLDVTSSHVRKKYLKYKNKYLLLKNQ